MPTITITVGTVGRDHATLAAAVAALPATLTDPHVIECYEDGGGPFVENVVLSGITTDAVNTLTIEGTDQHLGVPGAGVVFAPTGPAPALNIQMDNVVIQQLEVDGSGGGGNGISTSSADNIILDGVIIHDCTLAGVAGIDDGALTVQNSIIYGNDTGIRLNDTGASTHTLYLYNTLLHNDTTVGLDIVTTATTVATLHVYNSMIVATTATDYQVGGGASVVFAANERNIVSDATFPGERATVTDAFIIQERAVVFTDLSARDYSLQTGGGNFAVQQGWGPDRLATLPQTGINGVIRSGSYADIGPFAALFSEAEDYWQETKNINVPALAGVQTINYSGSHGKAKAAIIVFSNTSAVNTFTDGASLSRSLTDGFTTRCISYAAADGVTPTETWSSGSDKGVRVLNPTTGAVLAEATFEMWGTSGLKLNWSTVSSGLKGQVYFIGGGKAITAVSEVTSSAAIGVPVTTTVGFQPELITGISCFKSFDGNITADGAMGIGMGTAVSQVGGSYGSKDAQATPDGSLLVTTANFVSQVESGAVIAQTQIENFAAKSYDLTTTGFAVQTETACLALTFSSTASVWAGNLEAVPTVSQGYSDQVGFKPDSIVSVVSLADTVDAPLSPGGGKATESSAFGFTAITTGSNRTFSVSEEFSSAGLSNTGSATKNQFAFLFDEAGAAEMEADAALFAADGVWLDYADTTAAVRYWPSMAIGAPVAPIVAAMSPSSGTLYLEDTIPAITIEGSSDLAVVGLTVEPQPVTVSLTGTVVDTIPLDSDLIPLPISVALTYEISVATAVALPVTAQDVTVETEKEISLEPVVMPVRVTVVDGSQSLDINLDAVQVATVTAQEITAEYGREVLLPNPSLTVTPNEVTVGISFALPAVNFQVAANHVTPSATVNLDTMPFTFSSEDVGVSRVGAVVLDPVELSLTATHISPKVSISLGAVAFLLLPNAVRPTVTVNLGNPFVTLAAKDVTVERSLSTLLPGVSFPVVTRSVSLERVNSFTLTTPSVAAAPAPSPLDVERTTTIDLDSVSMPVSTQDVTVTRDGARRLDVVGVFNLAAAPVTVEQAQQLIVTTNSFNFNPVPVSAVSDTEITLDAIDVPVTPQDIEAGPGLVDVNLEAVSLVLGPQSVTAFFSVDLGNPAVTVTPNPVTVLITGIDKYLDVLETITVTPVPLDATSTDTGQYSLLSAVPFVVLPVSVSREGGSTPASDGDNNFFN